MTEEAKKQLENLVKDEYNYLLRCRWVLVSNINGYVGNGPTYTDDSFSLMLTPPAKVRLLRTSDADVLNWSSDRYHLDPSYDVELVEPHPQLSDVRSLWVRGRSYSSDGEVEAGDIISSQPRTPWDSKNSENLPDPDARLKQVAHLAQIPRDWAVKLGTLARMLHVSTHKGDFDTCSIVACYETRSMLSEYNNAVRLQREKKNNREAYQSERQRNSDTLTTLLLPSYPATLRDDETGIIYEKWPIEVQTRVPSKWQVLVDGAWKKLQDLQKK